MKKSTLFIGFILFIVFFNLSKSSFAQCDEFKKWIPEWKNQKYNSANTAQNTDYLNKEEQQFYYFLNLMRLNPPLFAETFLDKCTDWNSVNTLVM